RSDLYSLSLHDALPICTGSVFTDTWQFDPLAPSGSKWSQLTSANLNLGRGYMAGAALDGKLYAIGGDVWNSGTRTLSPVTNVERSEEHTSELQSRGHLV